jgi:hypothetical protein
MSCVDGSETQPSSIISFYQVCLKKSVLLKLNLTYFTNPFPEYSRLDKKPFTALADKVSYEKLRVPLEASYWGIGVISIFSGCPV